MLCSGQKNELKKTCFYNTNIDTKCLIAKLLHLCYNIDLNGVEVSYTTSDIYVSRIIEMNSP